MCAGPVTRLAATASVPLREGPWQDGLGDFILTKATITGFQVTMQQVGRELPPGCQCAGQPRRLAAESRGREALGCASLSARLWPRASPGYRGPFKCGLEDRSCVAASKHWYID